MTHIPFLPNNNQGGREIVVHRSRGSERGGKLLFTDPGAVRGKHLTIPRTIVGHCKEVVGTMVA